MIENKDEAAVDEKQKVEVEKVKQKEPKQPRFYSVIKGESFADIEKKFKLQKGSLEKLNPLVDLTNVPNGKMIQIEG